MSPDPSLPHHRFADFLWIRCNTRGSFLNSPALKFLSDKYIQLGGNSIIVDLEQCQGVDSTFMGTLAGIARDCQTVQGNVQIASPTERTRAAMENLGLDMVLELDPLNATWQSHLKEIRMALCIDGCEICTPLETKSLKIPLSETERTRHVLEAHNTLRKMTPKNEETFNYVCESLEEDLRHREEADEEGK